MQDQDQHISSPVSALVMLAAIGLTLSTYGTYRDQTVADQQEQNAVAMDQAANVLMSYRLEHPATLASTTASSTKATTTATTTAKKK